MALTRLTGRTARFRALLKMPPAMHIPSVRMGVYSLFIKHENSNTCNSIHLG